MRRGTEKPERRVEAHLDAIIREYRGRSVELLRALPPTELLPDFRAGTKTWTIYSESTNLDDGGVSFAT